MGAPVNGQRRLQIGSGSLIGNLARGARRLTTGVARGEPNTKSRPSGGEAKHLLSLKKKKKRPAQLSGATGIRAALPLNPPGIGGRSTLG